MEADNERGQHRGAKATLFRTHTVRRSRFAGGDGAWREMPIRGARPPAVMGVLGRDAELGRIEAWLRRGEVNEPNPATAGAVLVIEGEPGIGKTTLWTEAGRRARHAGWDVLSGPV
jgi:hypothetical protein